MEIDMTSEATALQMALPLFNTKITSLKCNHCNGSGYKKSRYDGYMHVCSYCSGTGRKLVLTQKYDIEKGPTRNR